MIHEPVPKKSNYVFKRYKYITNQKRTSLVKYLFGLFAILSALAPIIGIYTLAKLSVAVHERTDEAKQAFLTVAAKYDIVSGIASIIYLICAIIFLFWIYRASSNTHALNEKTKIEYSPGWCVGSYFIPLLNLYWPYKAMKELWQLNVIQANVRRSASIVFFWWITYLLLNFTATIVSKLSVNDYSSFYLYILVDTASNVFGLISALLAIKIVNNINTAQVKKHESVKAEENAT